MTISELPHRAIAAILTVVFAAAAIYAALQLLWLHLAENPAAVVISAAPVAAPTVRSNTIAGMNLFGESASAQAQAVEEIINAPLTPLKLKLSGTVADAAGREGMAVIIDEAGKSARYMIGDALPGGATLRRVLWDRVVIDRLGQQELLKLPRLGEPTGSTGAAIGLPNPMAGFQSATAPAAAAQPSAAPAPASTPVAASSWEQTVQNIDYSQIQTMVNAQAVQENGRTVGFTLGAGADPTFLARLGLAPTDVVLAINGQALNDPTQTLTILAGLEKAQSAKVRIRRLGVEQDLTVNLSR